MHLTRFHLSGTFTRCVLNTDLTVILKCVGLAVRRQATSWVRVSSEPPVKGIFPLEFFLWSSVGSVLGSLSSVAQCCGFDPPLSLW